ncbi:hypothetical protein EDB86DRAFT_2916984 [Lactarius hatsudake]|nr:hypothetical protein EDB86DRAFT_2916984 [Lactarius hatsudake]
MVMTLAICQSILFVYFAGTLGTPFVSPTGLYVRAGTPQDVCTKVGWVLDSARPALGKSEAGATRPQLLGLTQLAYVRVDAKPDSNIEDNRKRGAIIETRSFGEGGSVR